MKNCRKIRYWTQQAAIDAAISYQRSTGSRRMNTYQCEECRRDDGKRAWHIGHASSRGNPRWTRH